MLKVLIATILVYLGLSVFFFRKRQKETNKAFWEKQAALSGLDDKPKKKYSHYWWQTFEGSNHVNKVATKIPENKEELGKWLKNIEK